MFDFCILCGSSVVPSEATKGKWADENGWEICSLKDPSIEHVVQDVN